MTPPSAPAKTAPAKAAPTTTEAAKQPAKPLTPERKARRGAIIAGAIALPLVTAGFTLLAVPLAIWQLATIVKTVVVVIANAVAGTGAAADANSTLASIDPNAMSGITIAFAIVGAVLLVGGAVVSVLVLRAHGVRRPGMVTTVAVPMGTVVATIVTGTVGALGGLLFGTSDSVSQVLGNAAIGIALTAIGSGIATIVAGALVWLWMAGIFHERSEPAKR
ncbi:hypothetical protein SAMN04489720_1904 [Agrococcus jejuensis]|uniref:Uncharacterized protein n=1 Tax=Agrococcus jejuensis TaxID=399736 RepID=A0A1G8E650_9MICO|nr:hypothetical protein SAMN04489720_1904 [Agrococcus jejuensis]